MPYSRSFPSGPHYARRPRPPTPRSQRLTRSTSGDSAWSLRLRESTATLLAASALVLEQHAASPSRRYKTRCSRRATVAAMAASASCPSARSSRRAYLSEEYFTVYGAALDQAKTLGLTLSLYDEYGFPSGSAGSQNSSDTSLFAQRWPDLTIKRLDKHEWEITGPTPFPDETAARQAGCAWSP